MKPAVFFLIAALMAGCSWLPNAGPTAEAIGEQATANGTPRFDIVEVNDQVVKTLLSRPKPSFQAEFGRFGKPSAPTISVGDTVVVSIWEGGDETLFGTGLVLEQTTGAASGSRGTTLPAQVVPPDGMITVPFVGRVAVAGRTTAQAQTLIQTLLTGKTAAPQVIVTVPQTSRNTVTVAGEVVHGARVPLSPNGDRLLDVIAIAGGAQAPIFDVYVRLSRNNLTTTIPYKALVDNPAENIYAWPGDVLTLIRVPHSFEAFGATGRNAQITFDQDKLDLAQALAKSSGLLDERADPAGVFLMREEPLPLVRKIDPSGGAQWQQPEVPVVYHFDLHDAKTYFIAQHFPIEHNDILYVAGAKANAIQKFFGLFGSVTTPVITGAAVSNSVPR
ncbi:MAG TPA: polysaccharide biosynthesis/export family protein [Stellaceae bacterium]|nr:polysaccharide biosynthesis/export family protein [Stellaceae bacterium]